jgi:hypothetical protein
MTRWFRKRKREGENERNGEPGSLKPLHPRIPIREGSACFPVTRRHSLVPRASAAQSCPGEQRTGSGWKTDSSKHHHALSFPPDCEPPATPRFCEASGSLTTFSPPFRRRCLSRCHPVCRAHHSADRVRSRRGFPADARQRKCRGSAGCSVRGEAARQARPARA